MLSDLASFVQVCFQHLESFVEILLEHFKKKKHLLTLYLTKKKTPTPEITPFSRHILKEIYCS